MTTPRSISLVTATLTLVAALALAGPLQAKDPKTPSPKPTIAESLLGYWVFDEEKMLQALNKIDGDNQQLNREMIEAMAESIVLQFLPNNVARVHSADDEPDAKFTVSKADEATGEFTLTIEPVDEEVEVAKAKIADGKLSVTPDDNMEFHLKKLEKAEALKRIEKIEKEAKEEEDLLDE